MRVTRKSRLRAGARPLLRPIAVMTAARLATMGALAAVARVNGDSFNDFLRLWDGRWYELIAQQGYPSDVYGTDGAPIGLFAFFPVYPLLVRSVHAVTPLSWSDSASLTSFLLALGAAALLWLLVRDWKDAATADRTVALFAFFPGTFVLSLHYSDGALVCAALACLLLLSRRRWLLAGLAGAVCTASRPNGVVIVVCCLWAAGMAIRQRREWRALIAPALAPLGVVGYFLYLWRHTGHAWSWFVAEHEGWHDELAPFTFGDRMRYLWEHQYSDKAGYALLAGAVFALIALVLLIRDRPPATLMIWTVGVLFLAFASYVLGPRPRFVMTAFPLFIAVATRLRRTLPFAAVVALFAVAQTALAVATALDVYLVP